MAYHSHFSEAKSIRRQTIKSLFDTVCITHSCSWTNSVQEIIKVRERILHIGPIPKVISRACFRGDLFMSFRFVSKQRKTFNAVGMSSWIFWLQERELRLSAYFTIFRNVNRSLNKRRKSPAQTITTKWTAQKFRETRTKQTNAQTQARQPNKQMVESAGRRSLPK